MIDQQHLERFVNIAGEDRGAFLATFDSGIKIYKNGMENSSGFFSLNVGIFNFGATFDPNTGDWKADETVSFVTNVGGGSISLKPSGDGIKFEVGASIGIVDIGFFVAENGDVKQVICLGVGNDLIGVKAGAIL